MIKLYYPISEETRIYGGVQSLKIELNKSPHKGDSCLETSISFNAHTGTHLDFPSHFDVIGKTSSDFPDIMNFKSVLILKGLRHFGEGDLVGIHDIDWSNVDFTVEALVIETGWGKKRDLDSYYLANPGISEELAHYVAQNFHNLKIFCVDLVSISSRLHRAVGKSVHHIFLSEMGILLCEDINLEEVVQQSLEGYELTLIKPPFLGLEALPVIIFLVKG